MATIGIHIHDDIALNTDATKYIYQTGFSREKIRFTIICDGSESLNHFNVNIDDAKWLHINRMRNIIDVTIDENFSLEERYATIMFNHNLDNDVFIGFCVVQKEHVYDINIDESDNTVVFDTLLEKTDANDEIRYIDVHTTGGGLDDFGILPMREYVKFDVESNFHEVISDNGIKLYKLGNDRIAIRNFGKASLYYDNYYIITLYHINDISKRCEIIVKYNLDVDSGFDFEDE